MWVRISVYSRSTERNRMIFGKRHNSRCWMILRLDDFETVSELRRVRHKPGSVPLETSSNGAVIYLGRQLPVASSGSPAPKRWRGRGKKPTVLPPPCTQPGFTEPAPLDAAGALLPHLCTLTPYGAVFFCGTILTIARTGRYPAGLVFRVPGLSSAMG
jgi:hypothetical protein